MRFMKLLALGLLICMCLGPVAVQSSAQTTLTITLGGNMGGQTGNGGNFPASTYVPLTGPFAQITLSQTGDVITVSGETLNADINFYDQTTEGGIFGFGPVAGTLTVGGCMVNMTSAPGQCAVSMTNGYDGYGTYSNSVGITPLTPTTGTIGTIVTGGLAFSNFSFTLTDTSFISNDPAQLLASSPGTISAAGGIASDVCEDGLTGGGTSSGCNTVSGGNVEHTYVSVTPEPRSYLLFGSGLLALGIFLRKRNGQSASQT